MAIVPMAACAFGTEGDFAATEPGLVSVESFALPAEGLVDVRGTTSDGLDVVVEFDLVRGPGELRIRDLQTMLDHGGTATLRTSDRGVWSAPETVRLEVVSDVPSTRSGWTFRELRIDVSRLLDRKALVADPVDDSISEEPSTNDPSSPAPEAVGWLTVVLVEEHC